MAQQDQTKDTDLTESAVAEGGAYEVIRKRLIDQGKQLEDQAKTLNNARLEEFGTSEMSVTTRVRVRTENNCIPRDMVQVGELLVFGFNVYLGLKKETKVEDVFALFRLQGEGAEQAMEEVVLDNSFLSERSFVNDFDELYRYYKHTRLVELTVKDGKLLAGFQIGERLEDIRVFRWSISPDGKQVKYIDNRGERDIQLPPAFDFEWTATVREDTVHGRHPHINILDKVFVETINGDLTIKVENNTDDGLGIYREDVEDDTQSIDDASIFYAHLGDLILLKIRPYREEQWRYLIFNTLTQDVLRIDAIGQSCVQLPEDHGIIFPGGYYLQTGEFKTFDGDVKGLKFKRQMRSPNGEDVLYSFYQPEEGVVCLLAYNLIEKAIQNPIYGHGYALADDGTLVIFTAEEEPTRVHPMQIWQTPFVSEEFASKIPPSKTFYGRIGNSELVRGVSDLFSLVRIIKNQSVSARLYEELSVNANKFFDHHFWIEEEEVASIATLLKEISATAELVIDEFEKVQSIRQQSAKTMAKAEEEQKSILTAIRPENWESAEEYVAALDKIRHQRGHLTTIKELRYIDTTRISELDGQLVKAQENLSERTVEFLQGEDAFNPYLERIDQLNGEVEAATSMATLSPLIDTFNNMASGLDLLSELMATLKVADANVRTQIVDSISDIYSRLNQSKAKASNKGKNLGSEEATAQFGAQFKLFSQSITNALSMASTPERCDEQLSRLLIQLEELESQFSDFDQFLTDIMEKREEVYETFETHKQQLLDERQRKAQTILDGANRILASIERRAMKFNEADELNTFFASDALVQKVRESVEKLRELDSNVKADDVESRLKSVREQSTRSLRDKSDIYEAGGNVIKLGPRHKFSVNTQELDLTILPREDKLSIHLTGTNFFESIERPELLALKPYWDMTLESETSEVYRSEYLAMQLIEAADSGQHDFNMDTLNQALLDDEELLKLIRTFSAPRYKEGYQKGVHDHDAALILKQLLPAMDSADLLIFNPKSRGLAQIYWANLIKPLGTQSALPGRSNIEELTGKAATWQQRAQSAQLLKNTFADTRAIKHLEQEVLEHLQRFLECYPLPFSDLEQQQAASYLVAEMGRERLEFISSKYAQDLAEEFKRSLDEESWRTYQTAQEQLHGQVAERWKLGEAWLSAMVGKKNLGHLEHYIPEAVALMNAGQRIERRLSQTDLELEVSGLLGDHPGMEQQALRFSLDGFMLRLQRHQQEVVPSYHNYLRLRQTIIEEERSALRLEEFKPRPLSSFVRNRLINESYLPIIGDNLAKQMGTVGESKRTDLMGLLMMISPPGYGKTTLMEYVANRLGLIFMKINCPSLGHDVLSLDPAQAPNATARQELQKLNLALEMGNNVMLYLDDIQHTHPEFLQKFISLCDGTRRIEGVWKGKTKTYDMRGRKFCVVMAGNPYTESGEAFKVPDMLANRADIYNLGDILGGMDEQFSLSYIENSLTSNSVLAPLATREMDDVYKIIAMAKGEPVAATDLKHQYSGAELNEMKSVLQKLFVIQDVILKINQQYIASAAQDDRYRNEPSFKLQGSYRNMNKMAEKVSSVMNDDELMQLISDHYLGEAQLLTTGAEENLLKLAALRGNMTSEEQQRWEQIKKDFLRNKAMGGSDADVGGRVVAQLTDLVEGIQHLNHSVAENRAATAEFQQQREQESRQANQQFQSGLLESLNNLGQTISKSTPKLKVEPKVEVNSPPIPGLENILRVLADTWQNSLYPLVHSMDKKIDIDLRTQEKMQDISRQLKNLEEEIKRTRKHD
ncbi:DNA repair protein [Hahella sp. CCB-MM4]|uniref:DNA repair ATPase n=1 Tax=Hahella sp. (strain CCB-MM4) TaxID=1926491 RepID=UPI000B9C2754|nr:DNA repair ATPase [Hahella sp. CCB-MM4]OZG71794.1 DNA repair protein [Hahella sp. CCB-MM4]